MELFRANYQWEKPIRSIGVRGADLVTAGSLTQLDLFERDVAMLEELVRYTLLQDSQMLYSKNENGC